MPSIVPACHKKQLKLGIIVTSILDVSAWKCDNIVAIWENAKPKDRNDKNAN